MKRALTMKHFLYLLFGFYLVCPSAMAVEQVVATVNGVPVLESQIKGALGKKPNTPENRAVAFNHIVDDILVYQAIAQSGIKVSQAQVDQVIEDIAAQNGLTFGQLLDALDYQGISYPLYRRQIEQQILMGQVRNQAIGKSLEINREEVVSLGQQLFEQAKAKGNSKKVLATEYKVRHILLKLNPLLNDAQAKAQLTALRSAIQSGKTTFAEAALTYSKDYLSGANGGSLGFAFPDAYVPPFAKMIITTKKGTISPPFKTEFGWHILEVTDTRKGDRTKEAYLQKAYEKIVNQQLQQASKDWVGTLRKHAEIKILAQ